MELDFESWPHFTPDAIRREVTLRARSVSPALPRHLCVRGAPSPVWASGGPQDVCLNTWLQELLRILRELDVSPDATYVFDEMEQVVLSGIRRASDVPQ
jgi:hypothetical protein